MRLVRIGCAVWDVLAIADDSSNSAWSELEAADPSDGGAEQMRALLQDHIPRNGTPRGVSRCRKVGADIWEFKEWGTRVLWFYDAGKKVICTLYLGKLPDKKFQQQVRRAESMREQYLEAKAAGRLKEPEREK